MRRFAVALAALCVVPMTAGAQVQGPPAPPSAKGADPAVDDAIARTREVVDPIRRCKPADDGSINVCGSDTERHRLSPELRAIAGVGRSTKDSVPHQPVNPMTLDKLPYNWVSIGGRFPPGPEYNALYEMAKRATDPDSGVAPPPEDER